MKINANDGYDEEEGDAMAGSKAPLRRKIADGRVKKAKDRSKEGIF